MTDGIKNEAVPLLSQSKWLQLDQKVRGKLIQLFGIKRSGATETSTGRDGITRVITDGYLPQDLMAISIPRMQEILDTDSTDYYGMFDEVVENINAILKGEYSAPIKVPVIEKPKKSYYKPKAKE